MMAAETGGFIYFFNARGTDRYKIGLTKNLARRTKELNGKQAPTPIDLLWSIEVGQMKSAEKDLHQKFKPWRVHNEWFQFSQSDLQKIQQAYNVTAEKYPVYYEIDWAVDGRESIGIDCGAEDDSGIDWGTEDADSEIAAIRQALAPNQSEPAPGSTDRSGENGLSQFLIFVGMALLLAFVSSHGRMASDQRCIDPDCANSPAQLVRPK